VRSERLTAEMGFIFQIPTELMLHGAELIAVPNACTWDDIRTAGLKTRAFENLVGITMANYPAANGGSSQAYTCVAWKEGKPQEMLIARAREDEELLLSRFNVDDIRAFRKEESWRMNYRRKKPLQMIQTGTICASACR